MRAKSSGLRQALKWGAVAFLAHLALVTGLVLIEHLLWRSPVWTLARRLHELVDFAVYGLANEVFYQLRYPLSDLGNFLGLGVKSFSILLDILYSGLVGGMVYFLAGFVLGFFLARKKSEPESGQTTGKHARVVPVQ